MLLSARRLSLSLALFHRPQLTHTRTLYIGIYALAAAQPRLDSSGALETVKGRVQGKPYVGGIVVVWR